MLEPVVDHFSRLHLQYRPETTVDPWVSTTLSKVRSIVLTPAPKVFKNCPTVIGDAVHAVVLSQEIRSLLEKGAIETVHSLIQRNGFYSTYLLVLKKEVVFVQF